MEKEAPFTSNLSDEVAVVTGGLGQLGCQFVQTLVQAGARVGIVDISDHVVPQLSDVIKKRIATVHHCDITRKDDVISAYTDIIAAHGVPTILINNAGIDAPPNAGTANNGYFEDLPESSWDAVIDSHLKGAFLMSQEFVRHVKEAKKKNSTIINISSTYGVISPDQSLYEFRRKNNDIFYKPVAYSVAKSGMLNFTRWLAEYGAPWGIRANCLVPGGVFNNQPSEFLTEYNRRTMLGRMAQPEEYNGSILFLASHKASSYMTGSVITVDGGWTAR